MLFAVLAYGAINDGQRLLFTGIAVFFLVWVAVLGLTLALSGNAPVEQTNATTTIPVVKVSPFPPKPPADVGTAILPMIATTGMSFHLQPRQRSPIFRN